jgi:hypothetical protein
MRTLEFPESEKNVDRTEKLTVQKRLSDDIGKFDYSPYPITIGLDGDEIDEAAFALLTEEQRKQAIYLTMAVNYARKKLNIDDLEDQRKNANTTIYVLGGNPSDSSFTWTKYETNHYGDKLGDGQVITADATNPLEFTVGKRYVFEVSATEELGFYLDPNDKAGSEFWDSEVLTDSDGQFDEPEMRENLPAGWEQIVFEPNELTPNLYIWSQANSNKDVAINIFLPIDEGDDTIKHTPSEFNLLSKEAVGFELDETVDLDALDDTNDPTGLLRYFATIKNDLPYFPLVTDNGDGSFDMDVDITNFITAVEKGEILLDYEDWIDPIGNNCFAKVMERPAGDTLAYIFGSNHLPFTDGMSAETIAAITKARDDYFLELKKGRLPMSGYFNPVRRKMNPDDADSLPIIPEQSLASRAPSHSFFELSNWGEEYVGVEGVYFDDIFSLLNIKDLGYGISDDGSGGQNLMLANQRSRSCRVVGDNGMMVDVAEYFFHHATQPRGGLYFGEFVVAPPRSYIPIRYKAVPRLDLFCFGDIASNLTLDSQWSNDSSWTQLAKLGEIGCNVNLRYRIYHDLLQINPDFELSDLDSVINLIEINSDTFSTSKSFDSATSSHNFGFRMKDGKTVRPLFKKGGSSVSVPQYKEAILNYQDEVRTYWILDAVIDKPVLKIPYLKKYVISPNGISSDESASSITFVV